MNSSLFSIVVILLAVVGFTDPGGFDKTEKAIRERVVEYCRLAKNQDIDQIKNIITVTPDSYWSGVNRTLKNKGGLPTDSARDGVPAAADPRKSDFDDFDFQNVSKWFPHASRLLLVPNRRDLRVYVKGDNAKVTTVLKYQSGPAVSTDFLLVKQSGEWRIFRVRTSDISDNFPY